MYIMQCPAGYAIPLKAGRYEIVGIKSTVNSTSSASRLILCDDKNISDGDKWGNFIDGTTPYDNANIFVDLKGIANLDANLEVLFPEPIKLRHGISAIVTTNLIAGSIMVYVR